MRLVTWNIWNGGDGRMDAIEQVLRDQRADVVALQEANDRAAVELLAEALGMEPVYGDANTEYAVAWLSRLPVAQSRNHRLPVLEKTLLEIQVEEVRLCTTHLSAGRLREHEPQRVAEAEAILAEVGATADVVVGDFNAVHPSDEIGTPPPDEQLEHVSRPVELVLAAGFVDSFRELHPGEPGWTYVAWHPWARVDYVFARQLPSSCEVIDTTPRITSRWSRISSRT